MSLRSTASPRSMSPRSMTDEAMMRRKHVHSETSEVSVKGGGRVAMGAGVWAAIIAFAFLAIAFALTWSMVTDDLWRWIVLVILIIAGIVIILWFLWLLFSGLSGSC